MYKEYVELHKKYKDQGFEIFAFPSNQFMNQEPKSEQEIKEFAQIYDVKFLMFSKIQVNGPNAHDIFKYVRYNSKLLDSKGLMAKEIPWNFTKFLLDRNGQVVAFYGPNDGVKLMYEKIEELLQN
jgi:glutathione peroxidase